MADIIQFPQANVTLRDYFAAKALFALIQKHEPDDYTERALAHMAYEIADAMMKAREEEE